jgi:ABC-2 type transport system permease protein
MGKIALIIQREYITRVRKRSFIIMSILGPVLFAALMLLPVILMQFEDKEEKTIAVIEYDAYNNPKPDSLLLFKDVIPNKELLKFDYLSETPLQVLQNDFENSGYHAVLLIPENIVNLNKAKLYSNKQPSFDVKNHIEWTIEKYLYDNNLRNLNISISDINSAKKDISIDAIKWTDSGEVAGSTGMSMAIGYASGFLIYMLVFIFGVQVMRGIMEEKTSRIIEVVITSVKPVQLMMGKIVGIAFVGLTQFVIWISLTFLLVQGVEGYIMQQKIPDAQEITPQSLLESEMGVEIDEETAPPSGFEIESILEKLKGQEFGEILIFFLLYFIGGYLLYAAMFAAVGSAVDNEADVQQFMMPVIIPLILGIIAISAVINNPDGPIAFWLSMIPFTSPIVMMARIPFEVDLWERLLSVGLLYLTFFLIIVLAAKIYRTGILMYGKKVNYRELLKWLRYKN